MKVESKTQEKDELSTVDTGKMGDDAMSPLRGDEAEEAEGKRKKKKEKKSVLTVLFDPFIVLYTGWRTYARQRVVFAGLALATLYMTVLGFDSITTGGCVTGDSVTTNGCVTRDSSTTGGCVTGDSVTTNACVTSFSTIICVYVSSGGVYAVTTGVYVTDDSV